MLQARISPNPPASCSKSILIQKREAATGAHDQSSRWLAKLVRKNLQGKALVVGRRSSANLHAILVSSSPRILCFANDIIVSPNDYAIQEADAFTKFSGYIAAASTTEAEQLVEYDPKQIGIIFTRRPFLFGRRIFQIGTTFGQWAVSRYLDSLLGRSESMFKKRAGELREALVKLGPAFVKIAQAVSSRPDVIPPAYIAELSQLQDRIAPFSTNDALRIIEQELGLGIDSIFSEITLQPVAAASLGQVYQARLRANGQTVAVKVQRPGVRAAIALDIFILRVLAGFVRRAGKFNTDLEAVVDEWAASLFREMDYEAEAQNGLRFRKTFGSIPEVVVPEMYAELSSRRVLVMEWIEGQKLSDANDLHLIEVGTYCSLTQLLDHGFYHADPHPGNLMRTYDGKLAYLDFGMMGEMEQNLRDSLIEACVHLVNRDFDALAKDFVSLGLLPASAQMSDVSKALTGVFQNAITKGVQNISFGDLSGNLGRTMYQFKFRIPSYFSLVVRSLTVLEGIALTTNPDYKVLGSSYPWIARKVLTDTSPQLRSTLKALLYKDGIFQVDRLESLVMESLRSTTTDSLGRKDEQEIAKKNLITKRLLSFILSEEGDFVRDTLLEEFAKGLDAWNRATFESATNAILMNMSPVGAISYPSLLDEEDAKNLDTFNRLNALVVAGFGDALDMTKVQEIVRNKDMDGVRDLSLKDAVDILEDILKLLPNAGLLLELPIPAQFQAASLPGELIGRLTSRVIARAIRGSVGSAAVNLGVLPDQTSY
ncbi:hypothetical protein KP509_26G021700 [Ceratopteris richardii]|uniref:ABC1 atypical kinase-like domain-containing protein n=1 Tax=Ceratopteris richardii TaxID=49495 RepID=A0A8T2RLJ2_CERRI|nr:hypothetical protein KP509_26G021700 [Ceratopteris richardii]KAH7296382.1 hypothetical protein KP509_26G021700 [Ceratopteris richardii]KAH7296383.1 hypothetical protein KP509_26G021700 [Ceratopteris richardii]